MSVFLAGSVQAWQMAVVQLGAIAIVVSLLRMPDAALTKADPLRRLLLSGGILIGVTALGLLPVPMSVARITAPGLAEAFPAGGWTFLSLRVEATIGALFTGLLALVVLAGSAVQSSARGGRSGAAIAAVGGLGALSTVAIVHAASGATELFGVIELDQPPEPYFAPLVNPNHTAILIVLLLPVCVGQAIMRRDDLVGLIAGLIALTALGLLIVIGSGGAMTALLVVTLVGVILHGRSAVRIVGAGLGAVTVAAAGGWAWITYVEPSWYQSSLYNRLVQYADFPQLFADYWLTGSGAGTYENAYAPVRSSLSYRTFRHAHSEPQEWLVEAGLIGLVAAIAAIAVLPRLSRRTRPRARWWGLGLLGVAVHACVDFPLHVPGVLLVVMLALGVWRGGFAAQHNTNVSTLRRAFIVLLVSQVLALGWWTRTAIVDHDVEQVLRVADAPDAAKSAADRIALLAPWRSEPTLTRGWLGDEAARVEAGRTVAAKHTDDATALRRAASLLIAGGQADEARVVLERAIRRDVGDYRSFVVYARLLRPTDPEASARAWADAILRWPWRTGVYGAPLTEGFDAYPIGLFWVDAIHEAEAPWQAALGLLLTSRGDHSAALLAYERAGQQRATYEWVPERALSLDGIGDSAGAEAFLERAAPHARENVAFYTTKGTLMTRWGRHTEAVDTYLAGVAALPSLPQLGEAAVRAAAQHSAAYAVETAQKLSSTGRLHPAAAVLAAEQALSIRRHRVCVELLDTSDAVLQDDSQAAQTLWSQCAAGCEDCAATPD